MTPPEDRKARNFLRLRMIRGHVLLLNASISPAEREKKTREILDLVRELEGEVALG